MPPGSSGSGGLGLTEAGMVERLGTSVDELTTVYTVQEDYYYMTLARSRLMEQEWRPGPNM